MLQTVEIDNISSEFNPGLAITNLYVKRACLDSLHRSLVVFDNIDGFSSVFDATRFHVSCRTI